MSKSSKSSRSKKRTERNSAVMAVASTAGRTLGRAVNVVERVVSSVRPRRSSTPARKRPSVRKRR